MRCDIVVIPTQVLTVPKIAYARTGDDRYSLLVSQLKDKVYPAISESSLPPRSELSTEGIEDLLLSNVILDIVLENK